MESIKTILTYRINTLIIIISLLSISVLPFFMSISFHDSQRLFMVTALAVISCIQITKPTRHPKNLTIIVTTLFIWGGVLTINAHNPWSALEFFLLTLLSVSILSTY